MYISLTGGLGNQLFQFAAALNITGERELVILSGLGKPRTSGTGEPELAALFNQKLPFKISTHGGNWLAQKSAGYILRMGISPKFWETGIIKRLIKILANLVLSLSLRRFIFVKEGQGVGFHKIQRASSFNLYCGYFQSYKWATCPKTYSQLMNLEPPLLTMELQKLIERAGLERPVIVHVRLGDYLSESEFGLPSKDYYLHGIEKAVKASGSTNIWVYSDAINLAKEFLPVVKGLTYSWIEEVGSSTSQTFQSMRFGSAYVIANSTFSWWAAFLKYEKSAIVVAPDPWFKIAEDPKDLIPKEWVVLPAQ